ncbi:MAG TPA: hypothetical protein VHZ31_01105 [Solirubrobacteraceae bacterium]|nr:hypothetical protein [Solirubrobacteraceae bacterium]
MIATSAGVATTAAVTVVSPAAASAMGLAEARRVAVATPSTPIPAHPIVAYVHDAAKGEVTIVTGGVERTYRDAALVKRLVAAAKSSHESARGVK